MILLLRKHLPSGRFDLIVQFADASFQKVREGGRLER